MRTKNALTVPPGPVAAPDRGGSSSAPVGSSDPADADGSAPPRERGRPPNKITTRRIFIRLPPRDRLRWNEAARAQGFKTLSLFVRTAVEERVASRRALHPEELGVLVAAVEQVRRAGINVNELLYGALLHAKGTGPKGPSQDEFQAAAAALKAAAEVLSAMFEGAARKLRRRI